MSVRLLPAVTALIFAVTLAAVAFVPFVAREFRKHGELGIGTAILRFSRVLYSLGLLAYVLIPLPAMTAGMCAAFADIHPQWTPFASFADLRISRLFDEPVRQFGYNVALFLPLGALVRHSHRRSLGFTVAIGFAISLAVELTQLTGIWFVYPCPYRLFDVDDLIANTGGTALGWYLAPILRRLPGRRANDSAIHAVTTSRRLLGMCCDVVLLWWLGTIVLRTTDAVARPGHQAWLESTLLWFVPALAVLVVTYAFGGSTLGQRAVLLRAAATGGAPPAPAALLLRWVCGLGGLAAIQGVIHATASPEWGMPVALAWCTVHAAGVTCTADQRGISGGLARLWVMDCRMVSAGMGEGAIFRDRE